MNTQPSASSEIRASLPLVRRVRRRAAADRDDHPAARIRGRGVVLRMQSTSALIAKPLTRGEVIVRSMSVSLTEPQVCERQKTVTRRLGCKDLCAAERIVRMTPIEVVSVGVLRPARAGR